MGVYAVIPVKGTSERVSSKNFRTFVDGISLTELKLRQTVGSGAFDGVFVSSDSDRAAELASAYGATFIRRDAEYCNNRIPWSDVIHHVAGSLPIDDSDAVCWSHSTSPLFDRFGDAVAEFQRAVAAGQNGLITVVPMNEYILTDRARPVNYAWGVWHPYTQDVEPLFRVTGAVYIAPRGEMVRCRYVVPQRPRMWETTAFEALDVDTDYDFRLAQLLHANRGMLFGDRLVTGQHPEAAASTSTSIAS